MELPEDVILEFAGASGTAWAECVDPGVFDESLTPDLLAPYLADANHWLLLAWAAGRVIGKCSAIVHLRPDKPSELYIDEIDVAPPHRGRGLGKALISHMLETAAAAGVAECWVGTESENEPARALYESFDAEPEPILLYYLAD